MRVITLIVVHCSAVKPDQLSSAAQIDSWHRDRGFHLGIGYHYVIRRDGTKGHHYNSHSIGICYEGGLDARGQPDDTRTAAQKKTMRHLFEDLHERYPRAMIVGHRDLSHDRDCPCFDAYKEYADLQPK